ncbi:hypothetical protein AB0J86_34485 [Micromonospora sp. NPDC049559]|uniref:hypothetical protein n=1 Tax=Micromonospora sp. NPDC049559 TaxID=3155923 RepID=UPI00343E962E
MDDARTTILPAMPEPPPVFVDGSGRRRRRVRRLAYGVGIVGLGYSVLVGVSLAGGPVAPRTVLPFSDGSAPTAVPSPDPSASAPADGAGATPSGSAADRPGAGAVSRVRSPRPASHSASATPSGKPSQPGGRTVTPSPTHRTGPPWWPPIWPGN